MNTPASDPHSKPTPKKSMATRALGLALLAPVFCSLLFLLAWGLGQIPFIERMFFGISGDQSLILIVVWLLILPALPALVVAIRALRQVQPETKRAERSTAIFAIVLDVLMIAVNFGLSLFLALLFGLVSMPHGRRFVVGGRPRTASPVPGIAWASGPEPKLEGLDFATRSALATAWLEDARAEHASVAAFSRLSLELMAAGAPPRLLERTQVAALDEIRHAQACFALANAYAGLERTAGPFPEAVLPARNPMPADRTGWLIVLAVDSLKDGCLGEGYAARVAEVAREAARDPAVLAALTSIAREEASHAELGWEVLDWCLEQQADAVAPGILDALRHLSLPVSDLVRAAGRDAQAWAAHGRLELGQMLQLRDEALASVRARALAHPGMIASRSVLTQAA